jgi:hypothetical protein
MADDPTPSDDQPDGTTPPDGTPPPPEKDAPESSKDDDKLPPELKAILDKERKSAREAARKAKTAETALAKATSELEKFRESQLSEQEKAIKAAREEGLTEGLTKGNSRLIRAEVIAAAAGKVADPDDVFAILSTNGSLAALEVGDNGEIDADTIKTAIDDLVKAKPHLASVRHPGFGQRGPAPADGLTTDQAFDSFLRAARR